MSVKQLVVFTEIPSDAQALIAFQCDTNTVLVLSGVNKSAYEFLANEEFFKEHYFKQHPSLAPFDKLYTILRSTHPSNCWKVMCKVMDAEWGINWEQPLIAKRVSVAFMEEAHPKVVARFHSEIEAVQAKDKEICGSYFKDPSSPIDKAWKEVENCNLEGKAAAQEYDDLSKKLHEELENDAKEKNVQIDELQLMFIIRRSFDNDVEKFISCPYEQFLEKAPDEAVSKDLYSIYQKMLQGSLQMGPLFHKVLALQGQSYRLSGNYEALESKRKMNNDEISCKKECLTEFLANPAHFHLQELSYEWYHARTLELAQKDKVSLDKCHELVEKLIEHPIEQSPESFKEVRRLINTCASQRRIRIWQDLYHHCANGKIEDSWAENHFKDFLPALKALLIWQNTDLKYFISVSERGYMSNPPSSEYRYSNDSWGCSQDMFMGTASEVGSLPTGSLAQRDES